MLQRLHHYSLLFLKVLESSLCSRICCACKVWSDIWRNKMYSFPISLPWGWAPVKYLWIESLRTVCPPQNWAPLHLQPAGGEGFGRFDGQLMEGRTISPKSIDRMKGFMIKPLPSENMKYTSYLIESESRLLSKVKNESGRSLTVTRVGFVPDDEPLVSKP